MIHAVLGTIAPLGVRKYLKLGNTPRLDTYAPCAALQHILH